MTGKKKKEPPKEQPALLCTCTAQREMVGEDHDTTCSLYRQRGSGISVLNGPRARNSGNWESANGRVIRGNMGKDI